MKRFKKIAALAGVILLLLVCVLPMVFALGDGEEAEMMFRGAFASVFWLPILLYAMLMVYKFMNRDKNNAVHRTVQDESDEPVIKNVVFDIGKVLMSFDWEEFLKEFGFTGEKFDRIAAATILSDVWQERDKGILTEEEYVEQCVALDPEYEDEIRQVMKKTPDCVKLYPYAETWVKYLKKQGYRIYIISNFSQYMMENNVKNMPFRAHADGHVFSYEAHELKPDPIIYQMLLEKYFLNAQECVMIDDRPENCEGARNVGMKAVEFHDFKQAVEDLKKLGVE